MNNPLTAQDLLYIIGDKEVQLYAERTKVEKATKIIGVLQEAITQLEQKLKDQTPDANSVPNAV